MPGEMKGFLAENALFSANAQKSRRIPPIVPRVAAKQAAMASLVKHPIRADI